MLDKIKLYYNKSRKFNMLNNNPTGFLSITVLDRLSNRPITFAEISVFHLNITGEYGETGEANLVVRHVTNEIGKVPLIELPVIRRPDENDDKNSSTTEYFITIRHFRYYPVNVMNIQIYPNITTDFNVRLTPLTALQPGRYEYIITPEILEKKICSQK